MNIVDVVIPVYNPDRRFYILIQRLLRQSLKPAKIWIVLTLTEKYGGPELLRGLAKYGIKDTRIKVLTVNKESFNHGGTRQMAAENTDADFCLFMTQDAVPVDRFLIEKMVAEVSRDETGVCYARQIPYKKATVREKFSRNFNYPACSQIKDRKMLESGNIKAIFCSDVCAMYDMKLFSELGGFERNVDFNEDMLYAHKVLTNGYIISYCAEAKVYHSHNLSFKEQFKRNREIAISQKEHPEVFGKLSSEKEGISYVKKGIKYILANGKKREAGAFIVDCGFRFMGYKIGKFTKVKRYKS